MLAQVTHVHHMPKSWRCMQLKMLLSYTDKEIQTVIGNYSLPQSCVIKEHIQEFSTWLHLYQVKQSISILEVPRPERQP